MKLKYQFQIIQAIRIFFSQKGFVDVLTPPLVENPGMETHIHPFQIKSVHKNKDLPLYLHTSPEFHMKKILAETDLENIFTLNYSFRDEPESAIHRSQFLMLEWYRKNAFYTQIMDDTEELIKHCFEYFEKQAPLKFPRITINQLFEEVLSFSILDFLNKEDFVKKIRLDFKDVPLPSTECAWDDYYFLLFLNKVEPLLKNYPYLLLYEYPAPLAALSTIPNENPRICERFEVYMEGIEICNAFNELTDLKIQKERFNFQMQEKETLYKYRLPEPQQFYNSLQDLPPSSGIALGVERLLKTILKLENPFFS